MADQTFAARLLARAEATEDPRKVYDAEGVVRLGSRWQLLIEVGEAKLIADALMSLRSIVDGAKSPDFHIVARESLDALDRRVAVKSAEGHPGS